MTAHGIHPGFHLRSVFLSDLHLGFRGCAAELLTDFLERARIDHLYLLGDILDVSSLRRGFYWPKSHNRVVSAILRHARSGTRVVYVPGNHDEELRAFAGALFGGVAIHGEYVHTTALGKRLWLTHGDQFDGVVRCSPLLARLGTGIYDFLLGLNPLINALRKFCDLPHGSLAAFLKVRVGSARRYIESFEHAVAHEARRREFDGVVCGHIHHAALREIGGVLYCNDGDWVESRTVLVEDFAGRLSLMRWPEQRAQLHPGLAHAPRLLDAA
jgi:UDP-2,3-diacylglucosamine pyrophosphatase LpxH